MLSVTISLNFTSTPLMKALVISYRPEILSLERAANLTEVSKSFRVRAGIESQVFRPIHTSPCSFPTPNLIKPIYREKSQLLWNSSEILTLFLCFRIPKFSLNTVQNKKANAHIKEEISVCNTATHEHEALIIVCGKTCLLIYKFWL